MEIQWGVGIWGQLFRDPGANTQAGPYPDSLTVKTRRPGHRKLGGQIGSCLAHVPLCSGSSPGRLDPMRRQMTLMSTSDRGHGSLDEEGLTGRIRIST